MIDRTVKNGVEFTDEVSDDNQGRSQEFATVGGQKRIQSFRPQRGQRRWGSEAGDKTEYSTEQSHRSSFVTNRVLFRVRLYFEKISSYDGEGTCTHVSLGYATDDDWHCGTTGWVAVTQVNCLSCGRQTGHSIVGQTSRIPVAVTKRPTSGSGIAAMQQTSFSVGGGPRRYWR